MPDTIESLYAAVPHLACKGLCYDQCSLIPVFHAEALRLPRRQPPRLRLQSMRCEFLTAFQRCSVYAERPMICRLWGVVEDMLCPHGCRPDRVLTTAEGYAFMQRLSIVAGIQEYPELLKE